jgi:hypothetical protein
VSGWGGGQGPGGAPRGFEGRVPLWAHWQAARMGPRGIPPSLARASLYNTPCAVVGITPPRSRLPLPLSSNAPPNRWLNRENIQLRNTLQQLNTLVGGAAGASTAAMASAAGAHQLGGGDGGALALAPPSVLPGLPAGSVPVAPPPGSQPPGSDASLLSGLPFALAPTLGGAGATRGLGAGNTQPSAALGPLAGLPMLTSLGVLLGQSQASVGQQAPAMAHGHSVPRTLP